MFTIQSCQHYVNWIFTNRFMINDHNILVMNSNTLIGGAFGVNSTIWPINTKGIILINLEYLRLGNFTEKEIQFILAHEAAHIFKNHSINSIVWNIIERLSKKSHPQAPQIVELFKGLLALFSEEKLPPNIKDLRNNEYEADKVALTYVTGDIVNAISCLKKLTNNDLSAPSHTWELFHLALPAMTLRQRITVLNRNYRSFINNWQQEKLL